MGFWSKLGKGLSIGGAALATGLTGGAATPLLGAALGAGGISALGAGLGAAGSALSKGSQASAHNRGVTIEALLAQDANKRAGAQDQRESESDIMKKLAQSGYLKSGGYQGRTGMAANLPSYGFGPKAATPEQMSAASTLEGQLMARLKNPAQTTDITKYTKPSGWEKFMGFGGALSSILGSVNQARTGTPPFVPEGPPNPYGPSASNGYNNQTSIMGS